MLLTFTSVLLVASLVDLDLSRYWLTPFIALVMVADVLSDGPRTSPCQVANTWQVQEL
jgi:hypothetical protein